MRPTTTTPNRANINNTTTTLVTGLVQPYGLVNPDIAARYDQPTAFYLQFAPLTVQIDRYATPLWFPLALIGCIVCILVYTQPSWQPLFSTSSSTMSPTPLRSPSRNGAVGVMMAALSSLHLIRSLFVLLIDLDTAWATQLLGWSQLGCPLVHSLASASRLAILALALAVCCEVLAVAKSRSWLPVVIDKLCLARMSSRKAIRLALCLSLLALGLGFVEAAYWRVIYYRRNTFDQLPGQPPPLIPSCQVPGLFPFMFGSSSMSSPSLDSSAMTDLTSNMRQRNLDIAASYLNYQWTLSLLTALVPIILLLLVAMAIFRAHLITADRVEGVHSNESNELSHIASQGLVQALALLPQALIHLIEPLARPSSTRLTDNEIHEDAEWQRYFTLLIAKSLANELADLPAACLLPISLALSRSFRRRFFALVGCGGNRRGRESRTKSNSRRHKLAKHELINRLLPDDTRSPLTVSSSSDDRRYTSPLSISQLHPPTNQGGGGMSSAASLPVSLAHQQKHESRYQHAESFNHKVPDDLETPGYQSKSPAIDPTTIGRRLKRYQKSASLRYTGRPSSLPNLVQSSHMSAAPSSNELPRSVSGLHCQQTTPPPPRSQLNQSACMIGRQSISVGGGVEAGRFHYARRKEQLLVTDWFEPRSYV